MHPLENDKYSLRSDAKRLFTDPSSASPSPWVTQISKVNSKSSRRNHTVDGQPQLRENLAVATVAMPAHYAAIYNVLQEVRGRLGEQWSAGVESVVEFGVGSGAGVWYVRSHHFVRRDNPISSSSQGYFASIFESA
jgi:hypothetical protein